MLNQSSTGFCEGSYECRKMSKIFFATLCGSSGRLIPIPRLNSEPLFLFAAVTFILSSCLVSVLSPWTCGRWLSKLGLTQIGRS